jgi:hypothetical protein
MARDRRPTGDDATVARKRYAREANRYIRNADSAKSPEVKARYMALAEQSTKRALSTYEKEVPVSKMRKELQKAVLRTGVDFEDMTDERRAALRTYSIKDDVSKKSKVQKAEQRRENTAKSILNTHVGSRIFGSLSEIWQPAIKEDANGKTHIDYKEMQKLIFDFLGVSDWMGAIERFEEEYGEALYADPDNTFRYDEIANSAVEKLGGASA